MNLKVGDKLVCKKSFDSEDYDWFWDLDMEYGIKIIKKHDTYIITRLADNWYKNGIGIYLEDMEFHIGGEFRMMLWDYFYTPQEERKIKLENIKEIGKD